MSAKAICKQRLCECGEPALALVGHGKRRSRRARRGIPRALKGHDKCLQCWEKERDKLRAKRLYLEEHGTMTITELCKQSHDIAHDKGWHDEPRTFGDRVALMHSELSEALEEYRVGDDGTKVRGEDSYDTLGGSRIQKPIGLAIELADLAIRLGDCCQEMGIDLENAIKVKMEYNKTRSYRHGGKLI